jgi:hypothetical protein
MTAIMADESERGKKLGSKLGVMLLIANLQCQSL